MLKLKIENGAVFGSWTVIGPADPHKHGDTFYYLCRCKCGMEQPVAGVYLRDGRASRCRACAGRARKGKQNARHVYKPIPIGSVFGQWTVIGEPEATDSYGVYVWPCKCSCGATDKVRGQSLRIGHSTRCIKCADAKQRGRPMVFDLTGQTIGTWFVVRRIPVKERTQSNHCWLCRCTHCGKERERSMPQLRRRDGCQRCMGDKRRIRPYEAIYNAIRYKILNRKDRRNYEFSLTYEGFLAMVETGRCHYCWTPLVWTRHNASGNKTSAHHLDRKDNSRGYTDLNCVPCCWRCNFGKGGFFSYEEWWHMTECFRNGTLPIPPADKYFTHGFRYKLQTHKLVELIGKPQTKV